MKTPWNNTVYIRTYRTDAFTDSFTDSFTDGFWHTENLLYWRCDDVWLANEKIHPKNTLRIIRAWEWRGFSLCIYASSRNDDVHARQSTTNITHEMTDEIHGRKIHAIDARDLCTKIHDFFTVVDWREWQSSSMDFSGSLNFRKILKFLSCPTGLVLITTYSNIWRRAPYMIFGPWLLQQELCDLSLLLCLLNEWFL